MTDAGNTECSTRTDVRRLVDIMARLRDRDSGCPWDVQQNFSSIAVYTIEEAYEVADAIDRGDLPELKDELGDLLFQVAFHSRLAEEQGAFAFADVIDAICEKMIRRHPHVFDAAAHALALEKNTAGSSGDATVVLQAWEEGKRRERETKSGRPDDSVLAGIARGLPEWQRALKLQKRAAKVGFDWPSPEPVFDKLHEEIEEVRVEFAAVTADANDADARDRLEDEIGDVLFVCANLARHAKVDPGAALRRANQKFERRFRRMEALAHERGLDFSALDLARQDALWNAAKSEEKA